MILHSIHAQNFMKFRSLELSHLPETGLIGIMGDNETGKTTLGHAILFALFGEAPGDDPMRLVNWDADQMKITVVFTAEGQGRFEVYRELDRSGTNYVRLRSLEDEKDSCSGNIAVSTRLEEMLGVTGDEFKVSFFLAQNDVDFLRPGRNGPDHVLDEILGLTGLHDLADSAERTLKEIERGVHQISEDLKVRDSVYQGTFEDPERELLLVKEIEELTEATGKHRAEVESLEGREKALGDEIDRRAEALEALDTLKASREPEPVHEGVERLLEIEAIPIDGAEEALAKVASARETLRDGLVSLQGYFQAFAALREAVGAAANRIYERVRSLASESEQLGKEYRGIARSIRRSGRVALFTGLIGLASGGWAVVTLLKYPYNVERVPIIPGGPELSRVDLLLGLALVATVFLALTILPLFGFLRRRRRRRDAHARKEEIANLLRELEEQKSFCVSYAERGTTLPAAQIEDLGDEEATAALHSLVEAYPDLVEHGHASSPHWDLVQRSGEAIRALLEDERESAIADRAVQEEILREKDGKLRDAEESLASFRQKQVMMQKLGEEKEALESDLQQARHEAKVHETLARESREAAEALRSRFGPALARFLKPILPEVTRGRYSNVQVGPDLDVRVFSTEKNDFLDLDELSGGTLEQLLLAVRLGLSQALVQSRGSGGLGSQFLFLDEPFPASDRSRSARFGRILRDLGAFSQVFVTSQVPEVLPTGDYDLIVETEIDRTDLVVTAMGASAEPEESPVSTEADPEGPVVEPAPGGEAEAPETTPAT